MGFNVSFSKRHPQRFYLPGQEIKISRGVTATKSYTTESDNVLTCRQRTLFSMFCFIFAYAILCIRVSFVCLSNGIIIDTAVTGDQIADSDIIRFKNPVKRADILDRNGEIIPAFPLESETPFFTRGPSIPLCFVRM